MLLNVILVKGPEETKLMSAIDPKLLQYIRDLEKARFDRKENAWYIHNSEIDDFVSLISRNGFEISYF